MDIDNINEEIEKFKKEAVINDTEIEGLKLSIKGTKEELLERLKNNEIWDI